MADQLKQNISSMAREIRAQARDVNVDTVLSYLYTSDVINRYLDLVLQDNNISRSGLSVLHNLILNHGSMIPTDISRKTFRSKYSVTRVIDTLEKQGLVRCCPAGRDRRTRRIDITRKGLRIVENATIDARERISRNIFHDLDKESLAEFNGALRKVRRHVLGLIDEINYRKKDESPKRATAADQYYDERGT
jgi:DNA-binding MarR family transcriptional regulator